MIDRSCSCVLAMTEPGQGCEPLGGAVCPGEKAYDISPMISEKKRKKKNPHFLMSFCSMSIENVIVCTHTNACGRMGKIGQLCVGQNPRTMVPGVKAHTSTATSSLPLITESLFFGVTMYAARRQSPASSGGLASGQ